MYAAITSNGNAYPPTQPKLSLVSSPYPDNLRGKNQYKRFHFVDAGVERDAGQQHCGYNQNMIPGNEAPLAVDRNIQSAYKASWYRFDLY